MALVGPDGPYKSRLMLPKELVSSFTNYFYNSVEFLQQELLELLRGPVRPELSLLHLVLLLPPEK